LVPVDVEVDMLAEGVAELHVDKQREGRTGTVRVRVE
jgi:replicative DNA helicase